MSIDVSVQDSDLSDGQIEAALSTVDSNIRDVVVLDNNIFVLLEIDFDNPRNIISLDADGTRRWRVADHPKLRSPFQTLKIARHRKPDEVVLRGVTIEREFLISPQSGEPEYITDFK